MALNARLADLAAGYGSGYDASAFSGDMAHVKSHIRSLYNTTPGTGVDASFLQAPIDTPAYRGAYPILRYKDGKLFETGGGISILKTRNAEALLQSIPEHRRSDSLVLDWYKDLPPQYSLERHGSGRYHDPMEFNKDFFGSIDDRTAARWISDMSDIDNQLKVYGSRAWWDRPLSRQEGLSIPFVRDDIVQINDYMTGASDSMVISAEAHNEFNRTFVFGPDYEGEFANNDGLITLSGDKAASFAAMYQGVLSVSSKYELVTGYLPTQDSFFPESYETTMLKMQSALTGATAPMAAIAGLAARVMGYDERSVAGVTSAVASIENILQAGPLGMKINPRRMSTVNNYPSVTSSRNSASNPVVEGLVKLDPRMIRTTQTTTKQQGATLRALTESMKKNGFVVEPNKIIDVVLMPDGKLTSLDNTRIVAAGMAGVKVQARVHNYSDLLPNNEQFISRFIGRKGQVPTNWGQAVQNRISNQKAAFRNLYPMGSPYISTGKNY